MRVAEGLGAFLLQWYVSIEIPGNNGGGNEEL